MLKLASLALLCLSLVACTETLPQREASGCIHGDPGGPLHCQAKAYALAF